MRNLFDTQDGTLAPLSEVSRGWTAFAIADILNTHICVWGEWADNGDGTHTRVCALDSTHTESGEHTFNDGELTVAPTADTDGEITYTCTKCHYQKKEVAPKGTQYVTRKDLEEAIVNTAWAFYSKGPKVQYDGRHVSWLTGYVGGTARFSAMMPPEHATEDMNFYAVCSTFTHMTYLAASDIWVLGERNTPFGLSTQQLIYCAENQQQRHQSKAKYNEPWTDEDVDLALFKWIDVDYYKEKQSKTNFSELVAFDFFTSDHFTEYTDDIVFKNDAYDGDVHYSYYDKEGNKLDPQAVLTDYILKTTDDWQNYLRPGDLVISNDHTMLNAGGNFLIHCTSVGGGRITNTEDNVEPDGAIHADEDLRNRHFTAKQRASMAIIRPLDLVVRPSYDDDMGNDIVKNIVVPESSLSREKYPMMDIDRTVDITNFGTAVSGGNLTYTIKIFNNSNDENYLKWGESYEHGKRSAVTYNDLHVTETAPEGTELVANSVTGGGKVDGNNIAWDIASIAPGESVTLTYTVKVTAPVGSYIINDGGFVDKIPSNSIKNTVGGAKLDNAQTNALSGIAAGGADALKEFGTDTDFAEGIYKKIGAELELPKTLELATNLFKPETIIPGYGYGVDGGKHPGVFTEISLFTLQKYDDVPEAYKAYRAMMVDRCYGGLSFYVGEEQKWNFATKSILDFRPEHLEKGDIVIYFTTQGDERTVEAFTKEYAKVVVMVYDGEKLLISSANAEGAEYEIVEKENVYKALTNLIASADRQLFFVLRPSQINK